MALFSRSGFSKKRLFQILSTKPAPGVSESIQHGIFAYFVPPASLYALLAGIMWLNKKKKESEVRRNKMSCIFKACPRFEKNFLLPALLFYAIIALNGLVFLAARFLFGIGSVTNLNNQYPWGIWIGIDVAAGVALAAGGFTSAALGTYNAPRTFSFYCQTCFINCNARLHICCNRSFC